jgi:hypothetical protein
MDIFCTNQDDDNKPLDVMGDIYRSCVECVCLLDTTCDIPGFTSEKELLTDIAKSMEGLYERCDRFFWMQGESYFENLERCSWFNRVWTWQEAVLPPRLLFCCEQAGKYKYDPFDQEFLKKLFPYKFLEVGFEGMISGNTDIVNEMEKLKDEDLFEMLGHLLPVMSVGRKQSIWHDVVALCMSERECTEKQDYGIAGILNIVISNGLTLDKAIIKLDRSLQRRGIFIKERDSSRDSDRDNISDLGGLFRTVIVIDGTIVLGRVDDAIALKFNPGVVQKYESHGKILSKESYKNGGPYRHISYKYVTETSIIYLETDSYNIGDTLETTKIGREGCTFQQPGEGYKENEIFEITGNRVRIIGHIGNELSEFCKLLLDSFDDDNEE